MVSLQPRRDPIIAQPVEAELNGIQHVGGHFDGAARL
jgi:hypothetical protein